MEWPLIGRNQELTDLRGELADPQAHGVILAGEPGVGKTRLATELAKIAEGEGRSVRSAVGTESARRIPFGAVAHLLPPLEEATVRRADVLQKAVIEISRGNGSGPPLFVVDDAHLLDSESAALLHLVATKGDAFVVATIRGGDMAPDAVAALWKDDYCIRMDLGSLSRGDTETLIEEVLGGPVEHRTRNRLWKSSQGNVQYLRELVLAALDSKTLYRDGDLWRLSEQLGASPRLVEIVKARLGRLDDSQRLAVEMLALGEPLGVDVIENSCGDVLVELEQQRIVRTIRSGARLEARLDHPLHSEVLRTSIAPSRARSLSRSLAEGMEATGTRRRQDLLRLALWSLDGGLDLEPVVLTRAGKHAYALLDHDLAERMARAALAAEESFDAWLLLGNALVQQTRGDEAAASFDRAEAMVRSEDQAAALALGRADLVYGVDKDPRRAVEILRDAAEKLDKRENVTELTARATLISSMLGDARGPDEPVEDLPNPSPEDAQNLASTLVATSVGQLMMGRLNEAEESISIGLELAGRSEEPSLSFELLMLNKAMFYLYSGRVNEATATSLTGYEDSLARGATDMAGMWAMMAGELLSVGGNISEAARFFQESVWLLAERDLFGVTPMSRGGLARSYAQTGELEKAVTTLGELENEVPAGDVRARIYVDRAKIWTRALQGDGEGAVTLALETAQRAVEAAHQEWAATVLHIAVRLGRPASVVGPIARLAADSEGTLTATMAEHARALAASDPLALEKVVDSFESMGALIYAAEAASHACAVYRKAREPARAETWRKRSILLAAHCDGARTPALTEPELLTTREQEVASLAARGLATRTIAERLDVSARTIDNHLASIYRKLGAQGRGELGELLRPHRRTANQAH